MCRHPRYLSPESVAAGPPSGARSPREDVWATGVILLQLLQGSGRGDDATQLRLSSLEGPLRLNGEGQWTGARLRFRGTAQAADGQDGALANLLNIIGRRQGALSVISIG